MPLRTRSTLSAPAPAGLPEPVLAGCPQDRRRAEGGRAPAGGERRGPCRAEVIQAAANVARALKKAGRDARISLVFPEANSFGAALLAAGGLESAARALSARAGQALVIAETDLFRELPQNGARALLASAAHVIAVDHTDNPTTAGRRDRPPFGYLRGILGEPGLQRGPGPALLLRDAARGARAELRGAGWMRLPSRAGRKAAAWTGPRRGHPGDDRQSCPSCRACGRPRPAPTTAWADSRIPRKSLRESGRTAVTANVNLHEPQPAKDPDSPLAYTMEGASIGAPASLNARFWSPGWNSDQSLSKFQAEVSGQLVGRRPRGAALRAARAGSGLVFPGCRAASRSAAGADGRLLLVPRYHVFGSEELSSLAPGIVARTRARIPASLSRGRSARSGA